MIKERVPLLIPVENQVRELDPKLLLACIAAQRGFSSVIGSRREMEFNIDSFPRSIYLSKSMTIRSLLFFRVAKRFGHEIVTWDEEALSLAGVSSHRLPSVVSSSAVVGGLTNQAADLTGLAPGLHVVAGSSDGGLANLGAGAGQISQTRTRETDAGSAIGSKQAEADRT